MTDYGLTLWSEEHAARHLVEVSAPAELPGLVPDPVTYSAIGRLCVALIVLFLIASGLPGNTDSVSSYGPEKRQAVGTNQLRGTLDSISENVDDSGSEELAMGWDDLRNDLESVILDLENGRFSVDLDGLVKRVGSFRESFESVGGMNDVADDWDELTRTLKNLGGSADQ